MTVKHMFFDPHLAGADLHLLPGLVSPMLDHLLWLDLDSGENVPVFHRPQGVSASFQGRFDGVPGGEVTIDPGTGALTAVAFPTDPALRSFVVECKVTEAVAGGGTNEFTAEIRVHLHQLLFGLWLTPAALTVRDGAGNMRFTVLAEFGDGTIGDITSWGPLDLSPDLPISGRFVHTGSNDPELVWSARNSDEPTDPLPVGVDRDTGLLTAGSAGGSSTITVERRSSPDDNADATATRAAPWSDPVRLDHVSGPGFDAMDDPGVRNVLFLPDGFQDLPNDRDKKAFEGYVRGVVGRLSHRRRTRPWDLLKDRFNYFTAWVASPQAGVSVIDEQFPAQLGGVSSVLLNERDTAFHTAMGDRPRQVSMPGPSSMSLHPLRLSLEDLDTFLGALTDDRGVRTVGGAWTLGGPDDDLVVLVGRSNRRGGTNVPRILTGKEGRYLVVSLDDEEEHPIVPNPDHQGFDLVPQPVPGRVPAIAWLTVAHELTHSFGITDEYAGPGEITARARAALADKANAQDRVELTEGTDDLSTTEHLKWRWPRIETAGVLAAATEEPGGFRLRLEPGHARRFRSEDVVRLRKRPLLTAGAPSVRLQVDHVDGDDLVTVLAEGGGLDVTQFPPGSSVLAPPRAPTPEGSLGEDLGLVAASVLDRIERSRNPLDAAWDAPAKRPCTEPPQSQYRTPTLATNFDNGVVPRPPRYAAWIVGLYEQGARFSCGVYRPTGICLMREQLTEGPSGARERAMELCPVCRYAIVDLLDPTQHGRIDRDYARRYPE